MSDPQGIHWPDYRGGSIVNLVASLAGGFGLETGHPPFAGELPLEGVERVLLLIIDGLGHLQLRRHLAEGDMPGLRAVLEHGAAYSVGTSVFPSTTMAAMTTYHTGRTPAEHGYLGFSVYLPERGCVANLIATADLYGNPLPDPEFLIAVPSLYERLAALGVACCTVSPAEYQGSFLNRWYFRGCAYVPYHAPSTLASLAPPTLPGPGPRYTVAYWPGYDTVCHRYGPQSPQAADEVAAVDGMFSRLLRKLPRDGKTLLVLSADHGQHELDAAQALYPQQDARLMELLADAPAGEVRARYFRTERPQELTEHLEPLAQCLPSAEAWERGLFGGPPALESFHARTGDLIAVPRGKQSFRWLWHPDAPPGPDGGSHGGWSAEEMLVPVIAVRV